jgi:hypothetical protein
MFVTEPGLRRRPDTYELVGEVAGGLNPVCAAAPAGLWKGEPMVSSNESTGPISWEQVTYYISRVVAVIHESGALQHSVNSDGL